jgi:hypothetical protein
MGRAALARFHPPQMTNPNIEYQNPKQAKKIANSKHDGQSHRKAVHESIRSSTLESLPRFFYGVERLGVGRWGLPRPTTFHFLIFSAVPGSGYTPQACNGAGQKIDNRRLELGIFALSSQPSALIVSTWVSPL